MTKGLENRRFLISAGPMRTSIDAVRYVQNRASGRFGLAIAKEAAALGAQVQILLGPVAESIAAEFESFPVIPYQTPQDYGNALERIWPTCDVFMSLAAVLDFEVISSPDKLDRESLREKLTLPIRPVQDFAAWAGRTKRPDQILIPFAAEVGMSEQILQRAHSKMIRKNADAIIANPVWEDLGPEATRNELWILRPNRPTIHLGPDDKTRLARPLLEALFLEP